MIALGLILYASLLPEDAAAVFEHANNWIIAEAGWFYMLTVGAFVMFLLGLVVSPLGSIKLGPDESVPDYGYGTWIAMLFSAGMGSASSSTASPSQSPISLPHPMRSLEPRRPHATPWK